MIVFPAIDLLNNQCVRLIQGDFTKTTTYSELPVVMGTKWMNAGCEWLHVVNLNGALGTPEVNDVSIRKLVETLNLPIQLGGGIRTIESIKKYLNMGVKRVILGTATIENRGFLKRAVAEFGERIVVSIDSRDGKVATKGWTNLTNKNAIEFIKELEVEGVSTIVVTDILKDGLLTGPNFEFYESISQQVRMKMIASGGISSVEDIKRLSKIGLYGGIVGKAVYENKMSIEEALECSQNA